MKTDNDIKTIGAMSVYGGAFVKSLAQAALVADNQNLAIIKSAFSEIWEKYSAMAAKVSGK